MKTLMGLGLLGWIVAFAVGFGMGGVFFLSIRLQVEYVLKKKGKEWIVPACLYARMALVGVVLVLVAVTLPGEKIAGAMMAGTAGAILARLLVSRMVKNVDKNGSEGPASVRATDDTEVVPPSE